MTSERTNIKQVISIPILPAIFLFQKDSSKEPVTAPKKTSSEEPDGHSYLAAAMRTAVI